MKYEIVCTENTTVVLRYESAVMPVVGDFVALADEKVFHVMHRIISPSWEGIALIGLVVSLEKMYEIVTNQ